MYITSVEFQAIARVCDALYMDLHGLQIIDNGDGIEITTNLDVVRVVRYAGGSPFSFEKYVHTRMSEIPVPFGGKHSTGRPVFDVMADAWLDGLLSGSPVRTPLERELGVIYG